GDGDCGPPPRRHRSAEQGPRGHGRRDTRGRHTVGGACPRRPRGRAPAGGGRCARARGRYGGAPARSRACAGHGRSGARARRAPLSLGGLGAPGRKRLGGGRGRSAQSIPPRPGRIASRRPPRLARPPSFEYLAIVHRRDRGWRIRWAVLAAGDLLAACLAYLLAFILRVVVPFPLTQGYLPAVRFAEFSHHWVEMFVAQLATLYFLGLYETRAVLRPRPHLAAIAAAAALQALILIAVYFFRQDLMFPRSILVVFACLNAGLLSAWRL